jgi:prenyltransferase beta subunit
MKHNGETNKNNYLGFKTDQQLSNEDEDDPFKYTATIPGSMAIHTNGEMDIRGVYCALVCADILNIVDEEYL